ncbi:MAG: hypothetical protein Q9202_003638 [Teloschistes flavicans]
MPLFSRKPSNTQPATSSEKAPLAHDTDEMQRFTATGRPMPAYAPSALANMSADPLSQAPQFLPQKFTDDSILTIPIPWSALAFSPSSLSTPDPISPTTTPTNKSKSSILAKLKPGKEKRKKEGFRMVRMTRREYLAYWAKDEQGRYIGTEAEGERLRRLRERGEI